MKKKIIVCAIVTIILTIVAIFFVGNFIKNYKIGDDDCFIIDSNTHFKESLNDN